MHFSAKRGIAIACRLSVWDVRSPQTPTWRVWSKGNTPKFGLKVTYPQLIWASETSQIAAEWLQIVQRSQWRAYRKHPSLFLMVLSLTPTTSPSPKIGVPYAPIYANDHISLTGDPIHFMFGSRVGFSGTTDRMALFLVRTNPRWRPPPYCKNFKWPYLRNRSYDPHHVWFYGGVFGDGGSNGAIFDPNKFKRAAAATLDNFEWPYLRSGSRSTCIARIARSSLR